MLASSSLGGCAALRFMCLPATLVLASVDTSGCKLLDDDLDCVGYVSLSNSDTQHKLHLKRIFCIENQLLKAVDLSGRESLALVNLEHNDN